MATVRCILDWALGMEGMLCFGKKKASSLAAVSRESLAWTAFMVALVPYSARRLEVVMAVKGTPISQYSLSPCGGFFLCLLYIFWSKDVSYFLDHTLSCVSLGNDQGHAGSTAHEINQSLKVLLKECKVKELD